MHSVANLPKRQSAQLWRRSALTALLQNVNVSWQSLRHSWRKNVLREKLEKRVAVTEDTVLEKMKQKEAEVQALQLKVDSHQKHLRRMSRSPAIALRDLRPHLCAQASVLRVASQRAQRGGVELRAMAVQVCRQETIAGDSWWLMMKHMQHMLTRRT